MRKVFISSTAEDLVEYRTAAREAVLLAGCQPVMMEYFTPQGQRKPYPACMDEVDACDVVIAIVAHRYGWVPNDQPDRGMKSITWLECERAKEAIAFMVDEKGSWPPELKESYRLTAAMESGEYTPELADEVKRNLANLREFKEWLGGLGFRGRFTTSADLKTSVLHALTKLSGTTGDPSKYLAWLKEQMAWIDIRGLQVGAGKAYRFPIQDLYIPLTTAAASDSSGMRRSVPLEETLTRKRVVIVGDPGSGKTTFLRRFAYALPPPGFAIFIRIGELEEHIANCYGTKQSGVPTTRESPDWLAHFLATRSREYDWDLDGGYFEKKMHEEPTFVLMDGLDEAPDTKIRERIARLFENATQRFRECRFVVTTRPGAYQGLATLAGFEQFRIDDLSDEAVEQFLKHWSAALHPSNAADAKAHCGELLNALRARPEIRRMARNPVMLTALAVVHWNERRLPEQRADLYESILGWLARAREKPGRERAERCLTLLGHLALGMQLQARGRVRQIGTRHAAELIAPHLRDIPEEERLRRAEWFLQQEELDSGIVVSRSAKVEFWHLTFQEHLAARAIAGLPDAAQQELLIQGKRLYKPEWREALLLYAGLLSSKQGPEKVDAFFTTVLDQCGTKLADQARCAGLLGTILADLKPSGYHPRDPRYGELMSMTIRIFDDDKLPRVLIGDRVDAADALGQAGDPRLLEDNWVRIPAGTFVMGEGDDRHEVELSSYDIGKYPVTVQQYGSFVEDGGPEPKRWDSQVLHLNRPVVNVSWQDAAAYCSWAGVRLPTEAEWERAARGVRGRKYPWGNEEPDTSRGNYDETGVGAPSPVGLFPNGATAEGIRDLAGNVWEWVADWYGDYPQDRQGNPKGPTSGENRVLRGGSWDDPSWLLHAALRSREMPEYRDDGVGFRCAR